jgi:hypothetical protein
MAIPILLIGKSGSGKSASLRNLDPDRVALINVLGKPLPFRGKFAQIVTDNYEKVERAINKAIAGERDIIVVDDAGYLITNMFMRGHSNAGGGNGVFSLYNAIGDHFWKLIETIRAIPGNARVYLIMHEDMNDFGQVKPKTIGKLIDEKVCLEGMFTICLRCMLSDGKHVFRTQSDGMDVAKSPMGLFEEYEIDNDLNLVDQKIVAYYKEEE